MVLIVICAVFSGVFFNFGPFFFGPFGDYFC